jgi:plastocyanin
MRIPPALLVLLVVTIAAAPRSPRRVEITMTADNYAPAEAVATVGDTVVWKNSDLVAHTTTSKVPGWDSGKMKPGKDFRWVATKPGTWLYLCTSHRRMRGTLVVR